MKDIVEAALEHAAEAEDAANTDASDAAEFGPPDFAFVGCGEDGARRATETISSDRRSDATAFDLTTRTIRASAPESDADDLTADLAVVTAHLTDAEIIDRTAAAVDCLPDEATTLALVSVPETPPDTDRFSTAFSVLADAADTTVPVELSRLREDYDDEKPVGALADGLVTELALDVFEMAAKPLSAPVDLTALYDLLDTGGVALAYRGRGTTEDAAADLLDHAVGHRLCDGDPATAGGGVGFCRFGDEMLLSDYDELFDEVTARFAPPEADSDRWLDGGNVAVGFAEECRLTLLLTGIDPSSVAFLDRE
ncbi:hypothetical protein [Halorussus lipolyticus]|uniref:hypothetical protein n=1 Tax=Halorussus lipolyticus TaxID=3034024 RepID=UPI0023E8863E|nr:hypothetical protein [Halorussus sp. DT80]